jgi:hypothetical protein
MANDRFVVDTETNLGYIVRESGEYTEFPVATGQRRVVRYIGRTYDATTPEASWTAKSLQVKGDRITFGKSGKFLRLFKDGEERTPYGIHDHAYSARMLSQDERFESMGCIIVSTDMFETLQKIFELNGESLSVVTKRNITDGDLFASAPTTVVSTPTESPLY